LNWEIKKKTVTKEDLPYIISDVLHSQIFEENSSRILHFISCQRNAAFNYTIFKNRRQLIEEHAQGDGQFDAL
jgi:D-citramalate synthase